MGSRADDKLKEIEQLRASIDGKLGELEKRFPIAALGRKGAAMLAGSGALGTVAAFAWRRMRGKSRSAKRDKGKGAATAPPVVVNVAPKGTTFVVTLGIAVWAGVRLYEAMGRRSDASSDRARRPAVVKPMSESERRSGAGS
jgi:hypothetical protein